MDNMGEMFLTAFLQGIGMALSSLWEMMLANPWMFLFFGAIIAAGLWSQLAPRRRRRTR